MTGLMERVESQLQPSHSFHEPLGNLAKSGEIPTFPQLGETVWKIGKPKPGFPLSQPASRRQLRFCFFHRLAACGRSGGASLRPLRPLRGMANLRALD